MEVGEQMSVGRSGRMGKESRWMNEKGEEEQHTGSGTCISVLIIYCLWLLL